MVWVVRAPLLCLKITPAFTVMLMKAAKAWKLMVEILGWYGLLAVVIAYATVSLSFISPNSYLYQLLNLSGAFGLGLVAFVRRAYQNGVLNVVWCAIAVTALLRLLR